MSDIFNFTGNSMSFVIAIADVEGEIVNVSTATAIRYGLFDLDGTIQVSKTLGDGISVALHMVTVTVDAADTADLPSGLYIQELEITLSGNTQTVYQGKIWLRQVYLEAA